MGNQNTLVFFITVVCICSVLINDHSTLYFNSTLVFVIKHICRTRLFKITFNQLIWFPPTLYKLFSAGCFSFFCFCFFRVLLLFLKSIFGHGDIYVCFVFFFFNQPPSLYSLLFLDNVLYFVFFCSFTEYYNRPIMDFLVI